MKKKDISIRLNKLLLNNDICDCISIFSYGSDKPDKEQNIIQKNEIKSVIETVFDNYIKNHRIIGFLEDEKDKKMYVFFKKK